MALDQALGLSPRAAREWRDVHAQAVAAGYVADAEAMAWTWTAKRAGARAGLWLANAGLAGGHQATIKSLERVEGLLRRTLAVKASPPTYRGIVVDLGDLLVGWEGSMVYAPVSQAARKLAELGDNPPKDWKAQATAIVDELERTIAEDYEEKIGPAERQAYARYLAAAYKLGKAETLTPMGWSVAFDLEDQDALHGMTNSGLWWIGKAYGPQVPTAKILAEVERITMRSGLGREEAGQALEAALGSSFKRGPSYWTGLAATVATRSRTFGALSGLQAAGATTYEFVNPIDERTSEVCRALDGQKFTIRGGVELRDRLLNAKDPEEWKAISPWPKLRDLKGAEGDLLTPAELQAKGIAWPPLHFHCRSSIDVDTWAPIDADDLGPTEVKAPDAPKPPRKPRAARVKPGKPPPPPLDPWQAAKARLDAANAELQRLGLPTERVGLTPAMAAKLKAQAMAGHSKSLTSLPPVLKGFYGDAITPDAMTFRALQELVDELEGRGRWLSDGKIITGAADYADKRLAGEVRAVLDAYTRRSIAYREAMDAAPAAYRQAERAAQIKAMTRGLDKIKDTAQRAAVEAELLEALAVYDDHALAILRWDGVTVNHVPGLQRAYARGSYNLWESGGAYQALTELVTFDQGGTPPRWVPVRVVSYFSQHAQATVAHELGHVWDQVASGLGTTGARWVARADRPGLDALWRDGIDAPFRGNIARVKGKAVVAKLPGETSAGNKWMYAGRWVRDYEARIYNGAKTKPDAAFLARGFRGEGGPVEFIAMAHQYVQEAGQGIRAALLETRAGDPNKVARLFWRGINPAVTGPYSAPGSNLTKARELYGLAYRDGLEKSYRAGFRYVRDAGFTRADFHGDGDILGFAMAVRVTMGTPIEDLVGPGGPLAGLLNVAPDADHLAHLETLAGGLEKLAPVDAHVKMWNMSSGKPSAGYDLTDPTATLGLTP